MGRRLSRCSYHVGRMVKAAPPVPFSTYVGNFGPSVGLSSIEQSHCSTLAQKVCHLFTYVHDLSAMIRHTTPELNFHYETGHG
jgi:hypothetical protein